MALKDDWKTFGKNVDGTFKKLGKSIAKTVKVGAEKIDGDETAGSSEELKESWTEVGHGFGKTGKSLGKAITGTAKTAVGEYEEQPEKGEDVKNDENPAPAEITDGETQDK